LLLAPLPFSYLDVSEKEERMKYKLLGHSGLRVSELCLGTMTFGEEWGWGASKKESRKIFDTFAESGGNFIDTANRYTEGSSERYLGDFVKGDRHHFVLATKYTLFDRLGDVNYAGNHRKNLIRSVEGSLHRLGTDFIDVLYLHAWDFLTPVEEILRGLDDLVTSGKILYAGISDTPAWIVSEANAIADLRGWTRFNALQVEYSLLERTPERDLIPMAESRNMAVTAWAPLAGGALTGKYLDESQENGRLKEDSERLSSRAQAITKEVVDMAREIGCTPAQLAIVWTKQNYPNIIPIIGARKNAHLEDTIKCLEVALTEDQVQRLNRVSAIDLGFPHEFLIKDGVRQVVYGGTLKDIDPS
jgi:aryl-alcohol dehydrogenase-like predicted oxidoreductase